MTADPNRASRRNHRCDAMKSKLHLKFFGGPIGLLHSSREQLACDHDTVVGQILTALRKSKIVTTREELTLLLRRFREDTAYTDGVFVAPGACGYFFYAPSEMRRREVEEFLHNFVDLVPFYLTHCDGDLSRVLSGAVLPLMPELPTPIIEVWSGAEVDAPIAHGR